MSERIVAPRREEKRRPPHRSAWGDSGAVLTLDGAATPSLPHPRLRWLVGKPAKPSRMAALRFPLRAACFPSEAHHSH
jgi:hypothetical protein